MVDITEPKTMWRLASDRPSREGQYLCATKRTGKREPTIKVGMWTKHYGWADRCVTHWMELPENPND